jgi:hypothetical protein
VVNWKPVNPFEEAKTQLFVVDFFPCGKNIIKLISKIKVVKDTNSQIKKVC